MSKRKIIITSVVAALVLFAAAYYFLGGPMPTWGPWRYVASASSTKYHDPSCVWAGQINKRVFFSSRSAAEAKDYVPCQLCIRDGE